MQQGQGRGRNFWPRGRGHFEDLTSLDVGFRCTEITFFHTGIVLPILHAFIFAVDTAEGQWYSVVTCPPVHLKFLLISMLC